MAADLSPAELLSPAAGVARLTVDDCIARGYRLYFQCERLAACGPARGLDPGRAGPRHGGKSLMDVLQASRCRRCGGRGRQLAVTWLNVGAEHTVGVLRRE